jgi:hypothetical protein
MGLKTDIHTTLKEIVNIYFKINKLNSTARNAKLQYFSIYKHKKLNYFKFEFKKKLYNYSAGQLLHIGLNKMRGFKKSIQSFGATINVLNRRLRKQINSIYLFYIKNFTIHTYL